MSINGVKPSVKLASISKKDARWDVQRNLAMQTQLVYAQASQFERYAQRISECSGVLEFGFRQDPKPDESIIVLKRAKFCRVRYCPVCQWRRSMLWRAKFFLRLPIIEEQFPDANWLFLTLTLKNCDIDNLNETLQHMSKSWQRFIKLSKFKNAVLGYVRTTEVTRSEKHGDAHPHYHVLLMVKPSYFKNNYISKKNWQLMWRESLRVDYDPVIHIQRVKNDMPDESLDLSTADAGQKGFLGGVLEVLKYSVKSTDMIANPDFFLKLTTETHKMRFVATGGVLKDIFADDGKETNQDLVTASESPASLVTDARRVYFVFNPDKKKYYHAPEFDETGTESRYMLAARNLRRFPFFVDDLGYLHKRECAFHVVDDFGDLV
jgi:plasmid rolling circle replication initiator protein Rep